MASLREGAEYFSVSNIPDEALRNRFADVRWQLSIYDETIEHVLPRLDASVESINRMRPPHTRLTYSTARARTQAALSLIMNQIHEGISRLNSPTSQALREYFNNPTTQNEAEGVMTNCMRVLQTLAH